MSRSSHNPRRPLPPAARWGVFAAVAALCIVILILVPAPLSTVLFALVLAGSWIVAALARALEHSTARALLDRTRARLGRIARTMRAGGVVLRRSAGTLLALAIRLARALWRAVPWQRISAWLAQHRPRPRQIAARLRAPVLPPVVPEVTLIQRKINGGLLHLELLIIVVVALLATREYANLDEHLKLYGYEGEWLTSSGHFAAYALDEYGYIPLWQPYLEAGEPLIESPFSFVLNPFSAGPAFLFGGVNGIKLSVVITAVIAGLGGWALARVLGFGALGRVLLGLLLIGKGNMHAMIGDGYYQLGVTQAYFPWIIAGTIATLRFKQQRWPVGLTAIAFTLMFLAGNIWYTLPMLISMALLTLCYGVDWRGRRVDGVALRRMALAGALTVGLSAVLLVPIWVNRDRIGGHPDDTVAGQAVDRAAVIQQFYEGSYDVYKRGEAPGAAHFYYSFTSPLWFILLVFVPFPMIQPFRYPSLARVWLVALIVGVLCYFWGIGGHPAMRWLYDHVPGLGQWRFVGRALAVTSFWLAVLIVMRVDALWAAVTAAGWRRRLRWPLRPPVWLGQAGLAVLLAAASGVAAQEVIREWYVFAGVGDTENGEKLCIQWLRQEYPTYQDLAMYRYNYDVVTPFLDNEVRTYDIAADYWPIPLASTLGQFDWTRLLPRFGTAWDSNIQAFLADSGYTLLKYSPDPFGNGYNCIYYKEDVFPYVFSVPLGVIKERGGGIRPDEVRQLNAYERKPDNIVMYVQAIDERLVVAVQERAYPGWQVLIDGQRARLESAGGLIAVVLPDDGQWHIVRFRYRPPLLYRGGAITLVSAAFCTLYLLGADRVTRRRIGNQSM